MPSPTGSSIIAMRERYAQWFRDMATEMQQDMDASVARIERFRAAVKQVKQPQELLKAMSVRDLRAVLHTGYPSEPTRPRRYKYFPLKAATQLKGENLKPPSPKMTPVAKFTEKGKMLVGWSEQLKEPPVRDDEVAKAFKNPDEVERTFTAHYASVHGWDLIPQAARRVVRSIQRGYLQRPEKLRRQITLGRTNVADLKSKAAYRRFWDEWVLPCLRGEDEGAFAGVGADGWKPIREHIAACQLLADLLPVSKDLHAATEEEQSEAGEVGRGRVADAGANNVTPKASDRPGGRKESKRVSAMALLGRYKTEYPTETKEETVKRIMQIMNAGRSTVYEWLRIEKREPKPMTDGEGIESGLSKRRMPGT